MELEAIVVACLGKLAEVGNVTRSAGAIKGHANGALARREDRNLVTLDCVLGLVQRVREKAHVFAP